MMNSEDLFTEDYDADDLERIVEGDEVEENVENSEEPENNEGEDGPTEGGDDKGDDDKPAEKNKKIVRNPQPKLNEETLKGPRGLSAISTHFERVKFKGKGHELRDLDVILKTYEYWCHRLFPKFPFDNALARIEKLGSKRVTMNQVKRIRMDLDFVEPAINPEEEDQDNVLPPLVVPEDPLELTEEQLERMRVNRERAERLRRERLNQIQNTAKENLGESSRLPESQGQITQDLFESTQGTQNEPLRAIEVDDTQFTPNVARSSRQIVSSDSSDDEDIFTKLSSLPRTSTNCPAVEEIETNNQQDPELISQQSSRSGGSIRSLNDSRKRSRQILSSDEDDSSQSQQSKISKQDLEVVPLTQSSIFLSQKSGNDEVNISSKVNRRQILSSDEEHSSESNDAGQSQQSSRASPSQKKIQTRAESSSDEGEEEIEDLLDQINGEALAIEDVTRSKNVSVLLESEEEKTQNDGDGKTQNLLEENPTSSKEIYVEKTQDDDSNTEKPIEDLLNEIEAAGSD